MKGDASGFSHHRGNPPTLQLVFSLSEQQVNIVIQYLVDVRNLIKFLYLHEFRSNFISLSPKSVGQKIRSIKNKKPSRRKLSLIC